MAMSLPRNALESPIRLDNRVGWGAWALVGLIRKVSPEVGYARRLIQLQ